MTISNGNGQVKSIYIKGLFALVIALASAGHIYINAVFYTARAGEVLDGRIVAVENTTREIKDNLKENTIEQRKTQDVIQKLMIKIERDDARREALRERRRPNPALSPRYEPGGYE